MSKKYVCKEGGVRNFSCHPPCTLLNGIALIELNFNEFVFCRTMWPLEGMRSYFRMALNST